VQSAAPIARVLKMCSLLELNLSNNKLTDNGLDILAPAFKNSSENTLLERLDLSNNGLTTWGVSRLFEVLQKTLYLKKLILDDNNLSGKGMSSTTALLWENISLVFLSFNNCDIEPDGGESIGIGLSRNMHLQTLLLQNNR
jgi:Ran GTPase-activating protein (RanGAP) involved in mRNA processing and transport